MIRSSNRMLPSHVLQAPGCATLAPVRPPISRISHDFASFQSRMTLWPEIFSTAAVSSTLNPPEESQLDHLRLSRVHVRKHVKRIINRHQLAVPCRRDIGYFVEVNAPCHASSFI